MTVIDKHINSLFRYLTHAGGLEIYVDDTEYADENLIALFDPVTLLVRVSKKGTSSQKVVLVICIINSMKYNGVLQTRLEKDKLMSSDTTLSAKPVCFKQHSDDTSWYMESSVDSFLLQKIQGNLVQCVRPEIVTLADESMSYMMSSNDLLGMVDALWDESHVNLMPVLTESACVPYCDRAGKESFISDVGTSFLVEETAHLTKSSKSHTCVICQACVKPGKLRLHVAVHLLENHPTLPDENACGFCGRIGRCRADLEKGSAKGIMVVRSNCPHKGANKISFASMTKISTSNPSTNHPVKCPSCLDISTWLWSYGMQDHYDKHHPGAPIPEEIKEIAIGADEIEQVKKIARKLLSKK